MDIKEIILLCLATFTVAVDPEVYEEVQEYLEETKEIKRNIRNSQSPVNLRPTAYEPPLFDFKQTSQQDRLRARYAEQQKVNLARIPMLYTHISQTPVKHRTVRETNPGTTILHDWQPFQPRLVKQNREGKVYIGRATKKTKLSNDTKEAVVKEASERQDSFLPSDFSQVVYVHPSLLRDEYERKSAASQKPSMDYPIDQSENQLNVLTDLIGKNPNIQIEGLQRLLQEPTQNNYILPIVKNPEPFQTKPSTLVTDKQVVPPDMKIKTEEEINYEDIISGKLPDAPISQETLAKLQKQLDELSQRQNQEALANAQEQARAHVESQHKAIAAHMALMERDQKNNVYQAPQALPLVRQAPVYPTPISGTNMMHKMHSKENSVVHKYAAHEINIPDVPTRPTSTNVLIPNEQLKLNTLSHQKSPQTKKLPPISVENEYVVNNIPTEITFTTPSPKLSYSTVQPTIITVTVPTATMIPPPLPKPLPVHPLKAAIISNNKEVKHYAPNHIHEAVVQKQAEKTIRAQVMSNNNAILKKKIAVQKLPGKEMNKKGYEINYNVDEREEHPAAATTYHQQIAYTDSEVKGVYTDQMEDGGDDRQYAAKYAFGYQIKDNDEGMDYGHEEKRNGRSAEGSYYVVLPDGRRQKVEYYADDSGYHAKVTYENFAQHK